MAFELFETLKQSITIYTGLTPTTFFTVIAIGLALYFTLSNLFSSNDDNKINHVRSKAFEEKMAPPVKIGEISDQELRLFDGTDHKKPLLMAIKGQIYDVSQSRMFYGPGGPYALFAGKDASRALAKMSFEEKDLTGDLTGLGVFELDALQDWEYKFMSKYVKVGTVKASEPASNGAVEGNTAVATETDSVKPAEEAAKLVEEGSSVTGVKEGTEEKKE